MKKIIIKVLLKLKMAQYFNLNGELTLNGKSFHIPILGKIGLSNLFMSELWMVELLKSLLQLEDKAFVDVGVNTGQTLLKLRSISESAHYYGFEPNPTCVFYVKKLAEKNNFQKIDLIPSGISNKTQIGKLSFFADGATDSSASIVEDFRPGEKVYKQEYIPLYEVDEIEKVTAFEAVSILKIDVEGAELEVIESFLNVLKKHQPIILIEILPVYKKENTMRLERQQKIEGHFKNLNYSIFRVLKEGNSLSKLTRVSDFGIHSNLDLCDYVIVPSDKLDKFGALDNLRVEK